MNRFVAIDPLRDATCTSPPPHSAKRGLSHTRPSRLCRTMAVRVIQIARLLIILASLHHSLVFENLALRQQLALSNHRPRPNPTVRWSDRLFGVGLRLAWPDWKSALVIVRPVTVIAWHRRGFAWYWSRRSRPRGGRPQVGADVRRLTRADDLPTDAAPTDATRAGVADVP